MARRTRRLTTEDIDDVMPAEFADPKQLGELITRPGKEVVKAASKAVERAAVATFNAEEVTARRRALLMPHLWAGATGAAGALAWGTTELTAACGGAGIVATGAAAGLSSLTAGIVWLAKHKAVDAIWRTRFRLALAGSAVYVPLVSTTGPGWGMFAALLGAETALAAKWWRTHRLGTAPKVIEAPKPRPQVTGPVPADDEFARLWRKKLAGDGGKFSGSELYDLQVEPHVRRYTLQLDGANHQFSTVLNGINAIAGALQIDPTEIIPAQFDDGRIDRLLLQIVTDSPIKHTVPYTEPRWVDIPAGQLPEGPVGAIDIGPYGDGNGSALYRLLIKDGVAHGHISGDTGSGKSEALNSIAVSARASGRVVIVFLDGAEEGGSSPFLDEFADFAAHGPTGAERVIRILESWMNWRARQLKDLNARRVPGTMPIKFNATPEWPAILTIIDEAHAVFDIPGMAARWVKLLRMLRKHGIAVLTASQGLGVAEFGNSRNLRKFLVSKNVFTFRTAANSEKGLVPGLEQVQPQQLPIIPGYGMSGSQTIGARVAPFRAAYREDWDTVGDPLPRVPLDDLMVAAADVVDDRARYWSRRQESADNRGAEQATRDIEALLAGTWKPGKPAAGVPRPVAVSDSEAGSEEMDAVVFDFTRRLASMTSVLTKPSVDAPPAGLSSAEQRVWEAIRDGHTKPEPIRAATGWGETHVRNQLRSLSERGLIHQPGGAWGPYALVGVERTAV